MAEEVVLTVFKAETAELDAALAKSTAGLDKLGKEEEQAAKSGKDLTASLGNLAAKNAMVVESSARAAKAINTVGKETAAAGKQASGLGGIFGKIGSTISGAFNSIKGAAGSFFSNLTSQLQSAVPGVGGLGGAFSALTGPIGLAAGAVVGFIANFSRLDSVSTFLDGISIQLGFIGDRLANFDFRGLFDPATVAKDAANAQILANLADQLQDKQLEVNKANADAGVELAKLNNKLRDRTKSEQERLAIADQITAIEAKRNKDELAFIDAQIFAQKLANNQQLQGLGEVSDENKKKLADLEAFRANTLASSIALQENVERRRNSITEQGAAERAAIEAKTEQQRAAAAAKAAAQREKDAATRIEAEKNLATTLANLETEGLRAGLTAEDQRIFDIEKRYDDLAANVKASFDKLRALPGADVAGLNASEGTALGKVNEGRKREVLAEEQKQQRDREKIVIDGQKRINDALLSADEKALQEKRDYYDQLLKDNAKFYSDVNGLTAEGLENEKKLKKEAADAEAKLRAEQDEAAKAETAAKQARQQDNLAAIQDLATQSAEIIGQAAADGQITAEEASKALVTLALDTIEKLILLNTVGTISSSTASGAQFGGPAGAAVGLAGGIAITAVIKALFAAVKASIAGAYEGEEFISGNKAFPTDSKDQYLRRVHYGERIITADKNKKHSDILHAIHAGDVEGFINARYVMPAVNAYMNGDTGQRMASSVMLAQYYDKNIVKAMQANKEAIDSLPEAIAQVLARNNGRQRASQRRSW